MFGDVFEDMLRPELEKGGLPIWVNCFSFFQTTTTRDDELILLGVFDLQRVIGAGAGAAIGFIGGNLPGAAIGAYAGSKLGQVRDSKGKAVYEVFKDLGADQKAEGNFFSSRSRQYTAQTSNNSTYSRNISFRFFSIVLKGLVAKVFGMTGIGGAASRQVDWNKV